MIEPASRRPAARTRSARRRAPQRAAHRADARPRRLAARLRGLRARLRRDRQGARDLDRAGPRAACSSPSRAGGAAIDADRDDRTRACWGAARLRRPARAARPCRPTAPPRSGWAPTSRSPPTPSPTTSSPPSGRRCWRRSPSTPATSASRCRSTRSSRSCTACRGVVAVDVDALRRSDQPRLAAGAAAAVRRAARGGATGVDAAELLTLDPATLRARGAAVTPALLELLPAVYRLRDAAVAGTIPAEQGPLEALLAALAEQVAVLEESSSSSTTTSSSRPARRGSCRTSAT